MPDHPELANCLKERRSEVSLTQAELVERVGVSRKTINTVENGVFVSSTILALKLSKPLGVGVEQLFRLAQVCDDEASSQ